MRGRKSLLVLSVLLGATTSHLWAQEESEEPQANYIVMRFFQCPSDVVPLFQEHRPVAHRMAREGAFIEYGVFTKSWGDEWNVVDWFVLHELEPFFEDYEELLRRLRQTSPSSAPQPFWEACTARKESLYDIERPPDG